MGRPSEDALIARYLAPLAGPGGLGLRDDAGLATPRAGHDLVVTKDMLVAGVHFFADDPPDAIARKALRVNLSDLAAKGARPLGFLLGLALPTDWTEPWLAAFCDGLGDDARVYGCPLIGGDTTATPGPLTLSITAFGEVPVGRMVPRTGVQAGDRLYVTGTIGDAALGLRIRLLELGDATWIAALGATFCGQLSERYLLPSPRSALAPVLLEHARAAMDVSDGFVGDLTKMLRSQGLRVDVSDADIPLSPAAKAAVTIEPRLMTVALSGGDDYEILCAIAPDQVLSFEAAARGTGVSVAPLGSAALGDGSVGIFDIEGVTLQFDFQSFQHFENIVSRS